MENQPENIPSFDEIDNLIDTNELNINKFYQDLLKKHQNVTVTVTNDKTTFSVKNKGFEVDTNIDVVFSDEQITKINNADFPTFGKLTSEEDYLNVAKSANITNFNKFIKDFLNKQDKFIKDFTLESGKLDSPMSNDTWIVVDKDSLKEDNKICKDETNGYFIPINADNGMSVRYFVNNDERIPEGKVYYDYFGCGELFVNIPKNRCITGLSPYFKNIMNAYFLRENAELRGIIPTEHNIGYTPHASSTISPIADPGQSLFGWMFILDECFVTEERTSLHVDETVYPLCKFYSYATEEKVLVASAHYNFANHIPDFPSCACVEKTGKQNTVMACGFYVNSQAKCEYYSANSNNIVSVNISPKNTSSTINMKLDHFVDTTGRNVFDIVNVTDGTKLNQLRVPDTVAYEDAVKEAKAVFDEYMTCYTDHSLEQDESKNDKIIEKKSFIQTLVEV